MKLFPGAQSDFWPPVLVAKLVGMHALNIEQVSNGLHFCAYPLESANIDKKRKKADLATSVVIVVNYEKFSVMQFVR